MASLEITNDEVYARLGVFLGLGRTYANFDAQTQADLDRTIRAGRRKFFGAYPWSFLEIDTQIITVAPITTSTISATAGVVTRAAGTLPTDLAGNYVLVPDDETYDGVYEIASRDSATQFTLHDTNVTLAASTAYALYKIRYALPTNFGGFLSPITIANNVDQQVREYAMLPDYYITGIANVGVVRADQPELFSVNQTIADDEDGIAAWHIRIYPLPDAKYVLHTRIRIVPGDSLDLATSDPVAHPAFSEVMVQAILSAAEIQHNGGRGAQTEEYERLLAAAIATDKRMRGTRAIRPRDVADSDPLYQLRIAEVDMSGMV